MNAPTVLSGFADPVHGAQSTFRCVLTALSRPAKLVKLPQTCIAPEPLDGVLATLALALLDVATPVWLDPPLATQSIQQYLRLRAGIQFVDEPIKAAFGLIDARMHCPSLALFNACDAFEPHLSATLIIAVRSFFGGPPIAVEGPGIEGSAVLNLAGLSEGFWREWDVNVDNFPRGVDILFTDGAQICGLPRTVRRL
jgi:alpha-D-ribose 1-methylphosphonate 5-triphosphate synthase subunit PhnH